MINNVNRLGCIALVVSTAILIHVAAAQDGLVELSLIEPSIKQRMRYSTDDNFVGYALQGYPNKCLVTRDTAAALRVAQRRLAQIRSDLTLMVLDCYRPPWAVAEFLRWARAAPKAIGYFNPQIQRGDLVGRGYMAATSAHSRGTAVDVILNRLHPAGVASTASDCREYGGEVPMGSDHDCFDEVARFDSALTTIAKANRALLRRVMVEAGFAPYNAEWWHFGLSPKRK